MKRSVVKRFSFALCLLVAASALAGTQVFVPSSNVTFQISSQEKSYEVDDLVLLNYRVTNTSTAPLYVPREWEATCPTVPHIWAWFEDHSGNHLVPDFPTDCKHTKDTIEERMSKEAVLLKPAESMHGQLRLDPKVFHLIAGRYRVEAAITGWHEERFTAGELTELERMGHPFVTGEVPASLTVILTGDLPDHPVDHRL